MGRKPLKPTGKTGLVRVSARPDGTTAKFESLEWPKTKETIERFVVNAFVRDATTQNVLPFTINYVESNPLDHLDFTLRTSAGQKYLELLEVAPLDDGAGAFDRVPSTNAPYDFSRWILSRILRKSMHYGPRLARGTILVLYITHWSLVPSQAGLALLQYWTAHEPHNFEAIYFCAPVTQDSSIVELVFPTSRDRWIGFDPEAWRSSITHNLPPWGWQGRNG